MTPARGFRPDRRLLFHELVALTVGMHLQGDGEISYQISTDEVKSGWVGLVYRKDGVSIRTKAPQRSEEFKAIYLGIKTGKAGTNPAASAEQRGILHDQH